MPPCFGGDLGVSVTADHGQGVQGVDAAAQGDHMLVAENGIPGTVGVLGRRPARTARGDVQRPVTTRRQGDHNSRFLAGAHRKAHDIVGAHVQVDRGAGRHTHEVVHGGERPRRRVPEIVVEPRIVRIHRHPGRPDRAGGTGRLRVN